jgi:hypothetical protein
MLTVVEVTDSLGGLEGRVGVPNTTGFVGNLLNGVWVGRIGRGDVLDGASLNTDDTDWNTSKTSTTDNDSASPAPKSLLERVLVEKARLESVLVLLTSNKPSHVIRLLLRREECDVTIPVVGRW